MSRSTVSVIIRTFNEARHLRELLTALAQQVTHEFELETIIVDSGSTDDTVAIARSFGCRVNGIRQEDFTFGRSLNVGCDAAAGDILVFISGHCIPCGSDWLMQLIAPLLTGDATYVYGRQIGRDSTKFSEEQVFRKYYPEHDLIPQEGFYCNNANAALTRHAWDTFRFNEDLTGLEDMYLAKQLVVAGHSIAYCAGAPVYHIHDESWAQVRVRFEREAIALREIMPEVHMSLIDLLRCVAQSILHDLRRALRDGRLSNVWWSIVMYRCCQYWGAFRGHHEHRKLSAVMKRKYFYPKAVVADAFQEEKTYEDRRTSAVQGKQ